MGEQTIVAWDGSPASDHAVAWALQRAHGLDERLLIARIIDDAHPYVDELEVQRGSALANFAVAELAARLRQEHPSIEIRTLVTPGDPYETLAALTDDGDLLVVGGEHGMTGDYWYGSRMGRRLAATVASPVAIVPVPDDRRRSGVVAGVDDPSSGDGVVLMAADIARRRGEPLLLLHALERGPGEALDRDALHEEDALQEESGAILDEIIAFLGSEHPDLVVEPHVTSGPAAGAILRLARDASHVVVGTRRPGVLRRLFLGSVSHAVVNNARCPAIVVPRTRLTSGQD